MALFPCLLYVCCVLSCFNRIRLFVTLWAVGHHAPLSMGFSRQEYWSGLPLPPSGDLPDPGIEPTSLMSPALAGGFFTTRATWEALPCLLGSEWKSLSSNSLRPHGLYSPWNSQSQNIGVSSLSLLQGIFPTQESNPGLPHCRLRRLDTNTLNAPCY